MDDIDNDDAMSTSSSSSSQSSWLLAYMLEYAEKMIAMYPNEEELGSQITGDYLKYINEILQEAPTTLSEPSFGEVICEYM